MAQSVERRIGSAEVTGSIPVTSLFYFFLLYIIYATAYNFRAL